MATTENGEDMQTNIVPEIYTERRISNVLLDYWYFIKGENELPKESDIDTEDLHDVWESCFLVQVLDINRGGNYRYTYLGKKIQEAYGEELTIEKSSPLITPTAEDQDKLFRQVIITRKPVVTEGQFTNNLGQVVKYRQCLLPFAQDDGEVGAIFGGMRFRIV